MPIATDATNTYLDDVCRGLVPGVTFWSALGERDNVGTTSTGEDIWRGSAVLIPTPSTSGEQMTIVSTSQADNGTSATGAITVEIHYLDAQFMEQEEVITLDGTTPVNTVATDITFVNEFYILTTGSGMVAAGAIELYKTGAASTVYHHIDLGGNVSLNPKRMVHQTHVVPDVFHFKGSVYLNQSASGHIPARFICPAKTVIKVTSWALAAGGEVAVSWHGLLYDARKTA